MQVAYSFVKFANEVSFMSWMKDVLNNTVRTMIEKHINIQSSR